MTGRLVRDAPFCSVRGQHGIRKGFITCSSTVARKARSYHPSPRLRQRRGGRGPTAPARAFPYIQRSVWKGNSANFALTEFCEVRPNGVLRSWLRASAGGIMLVVERAIPL